MSSAHPITENDASKPNQLDVVIIGAGFSGLLALYEMRQLGLRARVLEAGTGVGGVWFWNRYPGARCDVESVDYSFATWPELDQEWTWSERFSTQPEIEKYLNFVADKYDLRPDIQLETKVTSAHFDEAENRWAVGTEAGEAFSATYVIAATGMLSEPNWPDIKGRDVFKGRIEHTARWPKDPVDLSGDVAVIGAGSSGIQAIPIIAELARSLVVFQRTPNYAVPADNALIPDDVMREIKASYPKRRQAVRDTYFGNMMDVNEQSALEVSEEEREQAFLARWNEGSFNVLLSFRDLLFDPEANKTFADFLERKIREKVKDPQIADELVPRGYPAGAKRMCVDSGYFETFNRDNVTLVSMTKEPIVEITETGIRTDGREFEVDTIVFATGFDAFTGALSRIDIRGRDGLTLNEKWKDGPSAYLGLTVSGFPNLFIPTGPGSPSLLSNVVHSAEQHVHWLTECIRYLGENGYNYIEPSQEAEDEWMALVDEIANATLYTKAHSYYMGENIPGKPRMFMAYLGGVKPYREHTEGIAEQGYPTFTLRSAGETELVGSR